MIICHRKNDILSLQKACMMTFRFFLKLYILQILPEFDFDSISPEAR